jgi:hypothetical protein
LISLRNMLPPSRLSARLLLHDLESRMLMEPMREMIRLRVSHRQKEAMEAAARNRDQSLSALLREGAAALIERAVR